MFACIYNEYTAGALVVRRAVFFESEEGWEERYRWQYNASLRHGLKLASHI